MAAAAAAMDGSPHHAEGRVPGRADRILQRRPEARPAGAAVELGGRGEQVEVAARAGEVAAPFLVKERARERTLGRALAQHRVLIGRQKLAPLGIGMDDREGFDRPRGGRPSRPCRCSHNSNGAVPQQNASRNTGAIHLDEISHGVILQCSTRRCGAGVRRRVAPSRILGEDTRKGATFDECHTHLMSPLPGPAAGGAVVYAPPEPPGQATGFAHVVQALR